MNQMRGIQTVREALRLETYPMDRSAVYYTVGDIIVFDAKGTQIPVRDLLDCSPRSEFWSPDEVIAELIRRLPPPEEEVKKARMLAWVSVGAAAFALAAIAYAVRLQRSATT